jgi:hypothetical protein
VQPKCHHRGARRLGVYHHAPSPAPPRPSSKPLSDPPSGLGPCYHVLSSLAPPSGPLSNPPSGTSLCHDVLPSLVQLPPLPPPAVRPPPLVAVRPLFTVEAELGPGSRLLDDLLLAPFLTTRDLLSLSATATWLRPYRSLLRDIKINAWRDDVAPAVLKGLRHLHTLHVGSAEMLGPLAVSLLGEKGASPGVTLRRLILEWEEEHPARPSGGVGGLDRFAAWLRNGCPLLEEVDMSHAKLSDVDTMYLFFSLEGCPELRCLHSPGGSSVFTIAAVLEEGMCPKRQQLTVSSLEVLDYSHQRLAEALRACPRPALRDLHLISLKVGPDFGDAFRSGGCPGLKVLTLESPFFEEGGAVALLEALGEGACPDLTVLAIEKTGLGPQGARALARAMQDGGLVRLEELRLAGARLTSEEAVALGEALGEGVCPDLTVLELQDSGLGPQGARALAQAMRAGYLSWLEELRLSKNKILDEGVVALAEALGEGACPRLRELHLAEVGMDNEGHLALARAMSVGGLPSLERSDLSGNQLWDDLA